MIWGRSQVRTFAIAILFGVIAGKAFAVDEPDALLEAAFDNLVEGRDFKVGYPEKISRRQYVNAFTRQQDASNPTFDQLRLSISQALKVRNDPQSTKVQLGRAQQIAFEALEALIEGASFAGNFDLLQAARVAYPGTGAVRDLRPSPAGTPVDEDGVPYAGASTKQLTYSRLYFMAAIREALAFVASDREGVLRASHRSEAIPYEFTPFYVQFNRDDTYDDNHLKGWLDPSFSSEPDPDEAEKGNAVVQNPQDSLSAAFLYGSALERMGFAVNEMGNQLWKAAFQRGETKVTEQGSMLRETADSLRKNIHSIFLSTLPMAAQMDDGEKGWNSYQEAKLDKASVSVSGAIFLRRQILSGEKPDLETLVSAWDPEALDDQIRLVDALYGEVLALYGSDDGGAGSIDSVVEARRRDDEKDFLSVDFNNSLRQNFESRLLLLTGIDPSGPPYNGIREKKLRELYIKDFEDKFNDYFDSNDPNNPELVADGSDIAAATLQFLLAKFQLERVVNQIALIPQRIHVEEDRNNEVNQVVRTTSEDLGSIDRAVAFASVLSYSISFGSTGTSHSVGFNPGALAQALTAKQRAKLNADSQLGVDGANSKATVQNFLIEQESLRGEIPLAELNITQAANSLNRLYAEVLRMVEDHSFFNHSQDDLWYRDPSLANKFEKVEDEYQDKLGVLRGEVYRFCRMLEAAWNEDYSNPVVANATASDVTTLAGFEPFVAAESVFAARNHVEVSSFFRALVAWDTALRRNTPRGSYSPQTIPVNAQTEGPVSMRQDVFGLTDYKLIGSSYRLDSELRQRNLNEFRAKLRNAFDQDPANARDAFRLKLEFPFLYDQVRLVEGRATPRPLVRQDKASATQFDGFWNHRLKRIAVRVRGTNVFGSEAAAPNVNFEYYGNVQRISYLVDSVYRASRLTTQFPIPHYQKSIDNRVGDSNRFFGTGAGNNPKVLVAKVGSRQVTEADYSTLTGWPLFCDNIVLVVQLSGIGLINIENIEDIELFMEMEVGPPPVPNFALGSKINSN